MQTEAAVTPGSRVHISTIARTLELTILMPCVNEAETLATCIAKAQRFLSRRGW